MIFEKRLCRYMMHGSFQKLEAVRSWMVPCYIAATKMWVPGVFPIVHAYFGFHLFVEGFFLEEDRSSGCTCNVPTFVWLAKGHHEPIYLSRIRLHVQDMDAVDM